MSLTETKVPYLTDAFTWNDVLCRLRSVGDEVPVGCAARVTLKVLVMHGSPVQWFEPKVERLEPKRAARQFVEQVDG